MTGVAMHIHDIALVVLKDPVAVRRGVKLVRLHFDDWVASGEPVKLMLLHDGRPYICPIECNGRKPGWIRWLYRRGRDRLPAYTEAL